MRRLLAGCCAAAVLSGSAALADPAEELLKETRAAVESGRLSAGAREAGGLVVAVGLAPVASFGNSQRAGLRAEEKAELAALGELRLWALSSKSAALEKLTEKLGGQVPPEALRAFLGTASGSVEVRDVLAKDSFHDPRHAHAILVVAAGTVGAPSVDDPELGARFEEFLQSEPSVGEAAFEYFGSRRPQAAQLLLRQLEAEGLPAEPFRDPYAALDRELERLAGREPDASRLAQAKEHASEGREQLLEGGLDEARSGFLAALALEPLLPDANAGLAQVYLKRKMPRLAARFLELGFCGEGDRKALYELWSRALREAGRGAEAKLASALAAQTAPGAPAAGELVPHYSGLAGAGLLNAALLIRCDGLLPLADLRDRWPRRDAPGAALLFTKGKTAFDGSKDTREALELFLRAIDADPFNAGALSYAAASLRAQKSAAGARVFAALAVALDPRHAVARVNLALALEALGVGELALEELRRAQALRPEDAWSRRKIDEGLARLAGAAPAGQGP